MLDSLSLYRIIKTGFVNFWRNLSLSAAATMVMAITLVIFAALFILFGLTSYSLKTIKNTVDISVYFKNGLGEDKISSIQKELEADPLVSGVKYTSALEALEEFRKKHETDPLIQQSLNELTENPLPATLNVKAHNLEDYPALANKLNDPKYQDFVDKVNYEDNRKVIDRLSRILNFIISVGLGLIVVFSLIAILVIFNTITLTIYNRKEEVEIMRLVGATNWYIRGPFLVESSLYGIFAAIITGFLLYPVFHRFLPKIALYVTPEVTVLSQNIFSFWYLLFLLLVLGIILSSISTLLAIRRYLKI